MTDPVLIPVVLSGGAGARLWPHSREAHPKPFMTVQGGKSLIQATYERAAWLGPQLLTVTNRDYLFLGRDELDKAQASGSFLLEPFGRNTAPAIALAAHWVQDHYGPDALLLVLPADHLIHDTAGFHATVAQAAALARQGYLATFGIVPTAPETGFGYIEMGDALPGGHQVRRFVEKPDAATAQTYLDSGRHLWNAGMFCFQAGTLLQELQRHAPDVHNAAKACWQHMRAVSAQVLEAPADAFAQMPNISIDYAVMEKSERVAVVPSRFDWNDIGSWTAIRNLLPADAQENRAEGDVLFVDTTRTFVSSQGRLVATVGVDGLMIVDTRDALLVAREDRAQDVKRVVERLKQDKREEHVLHTTVHRPWGTYTVLEEGPGFKIKRIEVKPGASLSLQMHHHRSEHWVVVSGQARVTNGEQVTVIEQNQSSYIPVGQKHRLENPGTEVCVMIEVQCGGYLGEDDIVRFGDVYGRGTQ